MRQLFEVKKQGFKSYARIDTKIPIFKFVTKQKFSPWTKKKKLNPEMNKKILPKHV